MIDGKCLRQWEQDGFFLLRGFSPPEAGRAMEREILSMLRADPPSAHPEESADAMADGILRRCPKVP